MRTTIILPLFVLSACVTPQVTSTGPHVDFSLYKTVSYSVHATPTTEYGRDRKYGEDTIALLGVLLGTKLQQMGYTTADPADLNIDIAVLAAKPGDPGARVLIGFGAGRAVLTFDATFKDAGGKTLATFAGGRSHTGMELGESFAKDDQIMTLAATTAVTQVEQFMLNDGSFPEKKKRRRS